MRGYPYTSLPNRHLPNRHRPYKHLPNRHRPYRFRPYTRRPSKIQPKNHQPNRHRPSATPTNTKQNPNKHKKLLHHTKNGEFSHKNHHFHTQSLKNIRIFKVPTTTTAILAPTDAIFARECCCGTIRYAATVVCQAIAAHNTMQHTTISPENCAICATCGD